MKHIFLAISLTVLLCVASASEAKTITIEEAQRLTYEAVKVHNPGAKITPISNSVNPDFYIFAATWDNPKGSPVIGYFAVNPATGDVWDARDCSRITTTTLGRMQHDIQKRFHILENEYRKLRAKRPTC